MKIQLKRQEDFIYVKIATIEINGNLYRLSETNEGRLNINKVSLDCTNDCVMIHPRSGNEIELS